MDVTWTLLMPVTRPTCAWAALWAASLGQTLRPSAVLVADNGPVSVTSRAEWRFVVDALTHAGIPVTVFRVLPGPDVNVGRMRHLLLSHASGVRGLCDDDVLWEPRLAVRLCEAALRSPWACALQLTPNNESDIVGWRAPAFPSGQFGDEADGRAYDVEHSSGHALFMAEYDGFLAGWARATDDDYALTGHLGTGTRVVDRGCRAWEMAHSENRKWRPNSTSLGDAP